MENRKARLIKGVIQAIVVIAAGYIVRHKVAETHAMMWVAAGWLLTAWVVLRLALAFRKSYAKFRTHTESGITLENIDKLTTESMKPWARGFYMMEKRVYRGAWRTVIRKQLAPAGEYSVAGGPRGRLLAAGLLLLVVVCAALGVLAVPQLAMAFWPRVFAFAGVAGIALYGAIWIVGIRRNLKEGGHRITHEELILDLGIRCSGVVALDDIASCRLIAPGMKQIAVGDVWKVLPFEPANVLIELVGATELAITSFGSSREISSRFIALYVDQPASFVDAVSAASAGARRMRA
jgi:hypothetical protein